MRIVKMDKDAGACEVFEEPARDLCGTKTEFMTDEDGGASSWICLNHIRKSRIQHGGH